VIEQTGVAPPSLREPVRAVGVLAFLVVAPSSSFESAASASQSGGSNAGGDRDANGDFGPRQSPNLPACDSGDTLAITAPIEMKLVRVPGGGSSWA
jgi:hypothetical protein